MSLKIDLIDYFFYLLVFTGYDDILKQVLFYLFY